MRKIIFTILLLTAFSAPALAENKAKDVGLPDELNGIYKQFVMAMQTGDAGTINNYCLPGAITFTYEKREKNPEYGQDINIPWAKNGFKGDIVSTRKDGEGCYLIRTVTTAMWFIHTKSMGWKLYTYLDKPVM